VRETAVTRQPENDPGRARPGWYDGPVEIVERTDELIALTPSAAAKIKGLMAEEPAGEASVLRVAVQGGGCSGFEYALGFDRGAGEGDHELESHGVTVVVDPFSAPYLRGAEIDFLETIEESGFKISNPNVTASCGCGHSFQVAEGEAPEDGGSGCGSGCAH
jgi:iron-sulfur cluster assembly accessory protein